MYSPASIHPLSKAQVHKLLKGKPVRVKHGQGMKVHLSKLQHKKLTACGKKGCGMNLQFDPYQCSMHAKGGGFLDDLEAFSIKALPALTDVGKKLLNVAPEVATMMGVPELAAPINYLVDKYTVDHSNDAPRQAERAARRPKPAVEPAPFVVDLPAVPRRKPLPPLPAVPKRKQGGNIMEDFGDASQKFLQGAMRDTPDWLKGPEKDPLAFLYGGKAKKGKKGGRLLIDEPITTRQVVNQARDFVTDPLGTLGFGLKKKIRKRKGGALIDDIMATPQFAMARGQLDAYVPRQVQDMALKHIGGKARKPMSAAQKAALAKGRAALAAKRSKKGAALYPAGYKGAALMPAGY